MLLRGTGWFNFYRTWRVQTLLVDLVGEDQH